MSSHDAHAKKRLKNADTFKQDLNLRVLALGIEVQ
jgi:hypothetical protein